MAKRERKVSPSLTLNDVFPDPMSPSSSSSASKDETFEPTIEMMVNDFDDEQTLNEEEALGALEDAEEEINTLKQESEIPLEELLAKYQALPPMEYEEPLRKKSKKSSKKKHKTKQRSLPTAVSADDVCGGDDEDGDKQRIRIEEEVASKSNTDVVKNNEDYTITSESNDEKTSIEQDKLQEEEDDETVEDDECKNVDETDIPTVRRTHLLDLYPEGTFGNVADVEKDIPLETLYGVEDDEEEEGVDDEEDEEYKKKVMIGPSYQAFIPGLSQYGDILPYENEDLLIWEPSQVTEREVEAYLLKIRDINRNQGAEDENADSFESENTTAVKENGEALESTHDNIENNSLLANGEKKTSPQASLSLDDAPAVVKDNEQALHLLVQCGYDFKEALRRKRLNALPMTDSMSLWSEEECQKFEEGIQKYGKDFLKIRQNQIRTRTMRELVQFYYLWKKSERRDHNFANTDTVDHMDIYLNEDNEYGSNPASVTTPVGSPVNNVNSATNTRRNSQKNVSIMSSNTAVSTTTTTGTTSNAAVVTNTEKSSHKRRSSCNVNNESITTDKTTSTIVVSTSSAAMTK
ncbi:mesoderm induction early response protein 1 [Musca vetustissima]|uniref:mesoderm induction early response protein 1 n=1 Tax=Musca vetustissima TaxID=27455 RepID=UPI002AB7BAB4|nr:mesoderm induction early response protein 1 [Musca vetustissima]